MPHDNQVRGRPVLKEDYSAEGHNDTEVRWY